MQQFKSRGKVYDLPDNATHAGPGASSGLYYKVDGEWYFISSRVTHSRVSFPGCFPEDIVELKRNPFAFWNKIKGATFK